MEGQREQIAGWLDARELAHEFNPDHNVFRLLFDADHGALWMAIALESDCILVFTHAGHKVPVSSRQEICEAIVRINHRLKIGCFEMDFEDGELRFTVTELNVEQPIPAEVLERMIFAGPAMFHRYMPAFLSVIYGNEDVALAVKAAEL